MKRESVRIILTILLAVIFPAFSLSAASLDDVREIMRISPNMAMHSPQRAALDDYVYERFKATGFDCGRIDFPTAVFMPGQAELILADGTRFALHVMHPNSASLANLPGGEWSGKLADARTGSTEDCAQVAFRDHAALIDMDSRQAWIDVLERGATVLIFAGEKVDNNRQAVAKITKDPIATPRFYLTHEDAAVLRAKLAGSRETDVRIVQTRQNRWEHAVGHDEWVIVPGTDQADKILFLQAYKDARSVVPDLTPGATTAANLALLLRLLDYYAKNPPQCTMVISAVSDHCNYMRGEFYFMGSIFNPAEDEDGKFSGPLGEEMEQRLRDRDEAEFYSKIYLDTSPEMIDRLRYGKESIAGRTIELKQPLKQDMEYERNRLRHRAAIATIELQRPDVSESRAKELTAEREKLDKELEDLIAVSGLLNRFGAKTSFVKLSPERQDLFREILRKQADKYGQAFEDAKAGLELLAHNREIIPKLAGKTPYLYLPLDLAFTSERMGLFFQGSDQVAGGTLKRQDVIQPLARLSVQVAGEINDGKRYFADTIQGTNSIPWMNYFPGRFPLAANVGFNMDVASVGLTSVDDLRDLLFTPSDTIENAGEERMKGMLDFAQTFLTDLFAHPKFTTSTRPNRTKSFSAITFRYNLRKLDPYSVEVPTEPLRDAMVITYDSGLWEQATETTTYGTSVEPIRGQVASYQTVLTDRQGAAFYRGSSKIRHYEAYGFDPETGEIISVIDAGSGHRRFEAKLPPVQNAWKWYDWIALTFDCKQTDLIGLYDPMTRAPLSLQRGQKLAEKIILLDAVREASPDHYGIAGIQELRSPKMFWPVSSDIGIATIFTEPEMPFKIVCDKMLLLNATPEHPEGTGFYSGDKRLQSLSYTSAGDVQTLNGMRTKKLTEKGVSVSTAQDLFAKAEDSLEKAGTANKESGFIKQSTLSLSYAIRSYLLVRSTTTDLIKAIAVFLALVIPFCLFATKLLTPWTDIRAQIGVFISLFVIMAIGLAMLHPAFSLSQAPMIVLLAFAMVGLAVFVMLILHGRFDSNMRRMVEEAQGVESAESSRKTLAGVAFSVGVNNMRRRRIRTSLTAATIVLVTFTMLSVISVGQSLEPYRRKTATTAPYNGVLFAKPGMSPIFDQEMDHVVSLLSPYGSVVKRMWTQRLDADGAYMPLQVKLPATGKSMTLSSLLGVQADENGFAINVPLAAGRWFKSDDAREIIISVEAANILGITPETFKPTDIMVRGDPLTLVGLIEDEPLKDAKDLAGLPWLPLASVPDPALQNKTSETGEMSVSAEDAASGPAPRAYPLRAVDVGILPIGYTVGLPFTSCRSIAVKCDSPARAWDCAQFFVGATSQIGSATSLTYTGLTAEVKLDAEKVRQGEYSLGAPEGGKVGGAGKVVMSIVLAATIILNTMLGTVMERRKEISVYNSIGLNPTHVFVFFVAEAIVFGLIGSVAGYLIGQGLSQAVVKLNLLPGVNLNFSSMAVMVVIFASICTVIVSTLYPAYLATRAAVPSGQRKWKLPPPVGDELRLEFPFSFDKDHLAGVCAFLHQFMDLNSEASSGQFLAQDAHFGKVRDSEGREVLVMIYNITPIPFDLGVNQRMEIYGHYDDKVRAFILSAQITRMRGSDSSWLVVNQPFLESLRARLLSWRSQSRENQENFRAQGEKIFKDAPELPTSGGGNA